MNSFIEAFRKYKMLKKENCNLYYSRWFNRYFVMDSEDADFADSPLYENHKLFKII